MNMQNFGPEGGVNPYDNNDDRFGKPIDFVPAEGLDSEPANDSEEGSASEKLDNLAKLLIARNHLAEGGYTEEAIAKNTELKQAVEEARGDGRNLTGEEVSADKVLEYNKDCREFDELHENNKKVA